MPYGVSRILRWLNFVQFEMMEERLVNHLKTIGMGYTPFKVELKRFWKLSKPYHFYKYRKQTAGKKS